MTSNETARLLAMICSLYPTFRVEEEDMEATIIAWSVVLEPYDSNLCVLSSVFPYFQLQNSPFSD